MWTGYIIQPCVVYRYSCRINLPSKVDLRDVQAILPHHNVPHASEPNLAHLCRIQAVSLLGSKAKLAYRQGADGPPIQLHAKPSEGIAHALRIILDSTAQPNVEAK